LFEDQSFTVKVIVPLSQAGAKESFAGITALIEVVPHPKT